jgi:hypothetical protein
MDTASNHQAHAQAVRRWRKRFGWASIAFSLLLCGVLVQWRAQPFDTTLKNPENGERPAAEIAEAPDTRSAAEKALARARVAEAQAKIAKLRSDFSTAFWAAEEPAKAGEALDQAKAAEEVAARAKAAVEVIIRLETALRDLRELEDAAASEAEREQIRALIELVIRGVSLQNPMNTSDPPGDGIKSNIGPAAKADNVFLSTSVPIAAGALAVSLLGFLSTIGHGMACRSACHTDGGPRPRGAQLEKGRP